MIFYLRDNGLKQPQKNRTRIADAVQHTCRNVWYIYKHNTYKEGGTLGKVAEKERDYARELPPTSQ